MKTDLKEDMNDCREIKKQKETQKNLKEEMAKWEFGKGINNIKDDKPDVRDKI